MAIRDPWHDVSTGEKAPEVVNTIIEIPRDSSIKYEVDKETGLLKLDRFLYSAVHYPGDYGFIPQTLSEDGDPLDVYVITNRPVHPMTLARVKVIGVLRMIDDEEKDDKIIGVYKGDPRFKGFNDLNDIPEHIKKEIRHFFETYKELQGKTCKFPQLLGKEEALNEIERSVDLYNKKFKKENTITQSIS